MARQCDFSVFLECDELLALERLISAIAGPDRALSAHVQGLPSGMTDYLQRHLDVACSSARAQTQPDAISLSLSLDSEDAEKLAHWIGRLTVNEIETVLDDADAADTASLALWSLMATLRPVELHL